MDKEVQSDGNPLNRCATNQLCIAKDRRCAVVVAVKESQRLLLEEEENRVQEFEIFGEIGHIVQDHERLCPAAISIADGEESSASNESGEQLLNKKGEENSADSREDEVVYQKERLELEGLPSPHQLAATENNEVVNGDKDGRVPQRGHGRLANDKVELLGRISCHILEGLAKERPQVDAKRSFDAGKGQ